MAAASLGSNGSFESHQNRLTVREVPRAILVLNELTLAAIAARDWLLCDAKLTANRMMREAGVVEPRV